MWICSQPLSKQLGDVQTIITSLPSNKAPSCDKVNANILKDRSPVIAPIVVLLTSLINNSFSLSSLPPPWEKAEIVPILKLGDSEEPANTRPIHCCIFYLKNAEGQLTQSSLTSSTQAISYTKCKVGTALLHFTDELLNNMDRRKMSVIVYLDISKAFDNFRHDLMLCKLRKAGVSEPECAWFESYLLQR